MVPGKGEFPHLGRANLRSAVSSWRDRKFESISLQRGVRCELDLGAGSRCRRALVWEVERKLAEDRVRPIIFYSRLSTCWQPWVKGFTIMVNSLFSGWHVEDVWLDK
jgi:hypothetical protein